MTSDAPPPGEQKGPESNVDVYWSVLAVIQPQAKMLEGLVDDLIAALLSQEEEDQLIISADLLKFVPFDVKLALAEKLLSERVGFDVSKGNPMAVAGEVLSLRDRLVRSAPKKEETAGEDGVISVTYYSRGEQHDEDVAWAEFARVHDAGAEAGRHLTNLVSALRGTITAA